MKIHTTERRTIKRSKFRKALLPLLVATALGTSATIATPTLYAASTVDQAPAAGSVEAAPGSAGKLPAQGAAEQRDAKLDAAANDPGRNEPAQQNAKVDKTSTDPARSKQDREIAKVSEEGLNAMQALHAARLSIFEGRTDAARKQVGQAEKLLMQAKSDAVQLRGSEDGGQKSGANGAGETYIPIEGSIALSDAFVPTEAHQPALKKASGEMAKKDTAAALDTLELAAIDVRYTEVLMPLTQTEKHLQEARDFLDQGKFHEANLAMMKAEQGIVVNTVEFAGTPQNG